MRDTVGEAITSSCDALPRTPTHGCASVGRTIRTYLYQLCMDTECSLKNLPGEIGDRNGWRERERERERVKGICVVIAT